MAQDRLYLECKVCGKDKPIFRIGSAGSVEERFSSVNENLGSQLAAFIKKHTLECRELHTDFEGDPGFILTTESRLYEEPEPEPPKPPSRTLVEQLQTLKD